MPRRTDANQSQIVSMLRSFGAAVWDAHSAGHGAPDIWVCYKRRIFPMEIKSEGGKLTPSEIAWRDSWGGPYYVIHSIEEAMQILVDETED